MTASAATTPGAPCWIDLMTSDPARSRAFYSALFGWSAGEGSAEFGGYFMFLRDGAPIAGGMPNSPEVDLADQWGIYLAVDDARTAVAAAQAEGAQVCQGVLQIADLGGSAVLDDLGGARIGLWQTDTFAGFATRGEPGAPGWFELHTRAYGESVSFYRNALRWDAHTMSDAPEFRYTTLGRDEGARAGIMDASGMLPEGAGGQWSVYFAVEDTDAALAKASELGGSAVMAPMDTPYGRLAIVSDPTGAQFKLVGPNRD